MKSFGIAVVLSLACHGAIAQEADEAAPVEVPPPPPMSAEDQPDLPPPAVTIRREDGKLVEEYSSGGIVYMVRVTPEGGGPSYYLMDMDGDGVLEKTDLTLAPNLKIPHWVIFDW